MIQKQRIALDNFAWVCAIWIWIEGRNVLIDFWFAGGNSESVERSVAELIKAAAEVIVVYSTPGLVAVRRATSTIPIVFVNVSDPRMSALLTKSNRRLQS